MPRRFALRALPLALAAALALPACAPAADVAAAVAVGQQAPDFTLADLDGGQHSLADYRGKVVVLEWINPNCPVSRRHAEAATMVDLAADHPEVVWLAVNSTHPGHGDFLEPAAHKAYNAEHGIAYPVLQDRDGSVGKAYGAQTTPHMYVVDETGKLIYAGAIDDDPPGRAEAPSNYVAAALAAHAGGGKPDPASTKAYGCSVKYGA
jgi:peroxiredoxin